MSASESRPFIHSQPISTTESIQHQAKKDSVWPKVGSYVAVSLDIPGNLAESNLDSSTMDVYEGIRNATWVALLESVDSSRQHERYRYYTLRFVFQDKTPLASPSYGIGPDLILPIAPNVPVSEKRRALSATSLLPWEDCYHSSFVSATVLAKKIPAALDLQWIALSEQEQSYRRLVMLKDLRVNDLRRGSMRPLTSTKSNATSSPSTELPVPEAFAYERNKRYVVVNLSLDLSKIQEVTDPRAFFTAAQDLASLVERSEASRAEQTEPSHSARITALTSVYRHDPATRSQSDLTQDDPATRSEVKMSVVLRAVRSLDNIKATTFSTRRRVLPSSHPSRSIKPKSSVKTLSRPAPLRRASKDAPCHVPNKRSQGELSIQSSTWSSYHGTVKSSDEKGVSVPSASCKLAKKCSRANLWMLRAICRTSEHVEG